MLQFIKSVFSGLGTPRNHRTSSRPQQRRATLSLESLEDRSLPSVSSPLSFAAPAPAVSTGLFHGSPVLPTPAPTQALNISVISQNGKQVVLVNGKSAGVFDQVTQLVVSPDRQRYAFVGINTAFGSSSFNVVVDGVNRATYNRGVTGLQFSSNSKHYAFAATQNFGGNSFRFDAVEDGIIRGSFSAGVSLIQFSPDGNHFAIVGINNQGAGNFSYVASVDSVTAGVFSRGITSFQFSPDSQHYAFVGLDPRNANIVKDGRVVATFDRVLSFSFVAGDRLTMVGIVNGVQVTRTV